MTVAPAGMRLVSQASRADSGPEGTGPMRASSSPARGRWASEARGGSQANFCAEPAKLAAAMPTEAPSASSRRASEAATTQRFSKESSSQLRAGPSTVCTSITSTTSRPRAGSSRRLTVLPRRAVARQWMWRNESPGWKGRTPANRAGSTVRERRARRSPSGDISRSSCRTSAICGATSKVSRCSICSPPERRPMMSRT